MNPIQEAKQELEASIRYAENAIEKAKQTIEQAATYQEQTGREAALEAELQRQKDLGQGYYDSMMTLKQQLEEAKTNMALMEDQNLELKERVQELLADITMLKQQRAVREEEREMLEKNVKYLRDENERQKRDLTVKTSQAEAWKKEAQELKDGAPTMPVIPKAVAIAIFREGVQHGVEAACTELDNAADICIEEHEYYGHFEVSFTKEIDLADHVDTDWMRGKCGDYSEESVIEALKDLCVDKKFECRIHGVDDNPAKE